MLDRDDEDEEHPEGKAAVVVLTAGSVFGYAYVAAVNFWKMYCRIGPGVVAGLLCELQDEECVTGAES